MKLNLKKSMRCNLRRTCVHSLNLTMHAIVLCAKPLIQSITKSARIECIFYLLIRSSIIISTAKYREKTTFKWQQSQ